MTNRALQNPRSQIGTLFWLANNLECGGPLQCFRLFAYPAEQVRMHPKDRLLFDLNAGNGGSTQVVPFLSHPFQESLPAQVLTADTLFRQSPLDDHLRGDASVILAGKEEGRLATHAVVSRQDILRPGGTIAQGNGYRGHQARSCVAG